MDTSVRTIKTDKIFFPHIASSNPTTNVTIDERDNFQPLSSSSGKYPYTSNINVKTNIMGKVNSIANNSNSSQNEKNYQYQQKLAESKRVPVSNSQFLKEKKSLISDPRIRLPVEEVIPRLSKYNKEIPQVRLGADKPPSFLDSEWSALIDNPIQESNKSIDNVNKLQNHDNIYARDYKGVYRGNIDTKFWFEDPSALFQTFDITPNVNMTDAERLNAMTRVIIIIAAVMFLVKFPAWWLFLCLGLIVVIVFWYIIKGREQTYNEHLKSMARRREYLRRPQKCILKAIEGTGVNNCNRVNNIIRPINGNRRDINNQELRIISLR